MANVADRPQTQLYAVKVTNGQERTVAEMLADKARVEHISVMAILAQRLVRVLCMKCRESYQITPAEITELEIKAAVQGKTVYRAKGCEVCFQTGYLGRSAIYELLIVDDDIRQLIMKNADASMIKAMAMDKGMQTLRQDGARKVLAGLTSVDEVVRVTQKEA